MDKSLTYAIISILLLCYFCFCWMQSVATTNAGLLHPIPHPHHHQQSNIYVGAETEIDNASLVFVFALTFSPIVRVEMNNPQKWSTADIISEIVKPWYQVDFSDQEALFVFRNESLNSSRLEFVWLKKNEILDKFEQVFDNNELWQQDMQTESYEPIRNVSTVHLSTVMEQFTSSVADSSNVPTLALATDSSTTRRYRIILVINFAEKALANFLSGPVPEQYRHRGFQIAMEAATIRAGNYYFYALAEPDNVLFVRHKLYSKAVDKNRNNWFLIYVFALNSWLYRDEFSNVINAAKKPLDAYFAKLADHQQKAKKLDDLILMIPCHDDHNKNLDFMHNTINDVDISFAMILTRQLSLYVYPSGSTQQADFNYTSTMLKLSLADLERQFFGATVNLDGRGADAVRPMAMPKPRIYLVTDYVELTFLDNNLPDRSYFEFHVYALKQEVKERYENKTGADLVVLLDPKNPKPIRIDMEDDDELVTTTTTPTTHHPVVNNTSEKTLNFPFFIIPMATGLLVLVLSALCAAVIIYRRMANRMCWLHKLEQFKTEHLFAAYQDVQSSKNTGKKDTDCWEMRWDQLVMSTEQLGKGVFGEVRKATLTTAVGIECPLQLNLANFHKTAHVAVKMLHMHCAEKARSSFMQEIQIMKSLANSHRCVVHMLGCMSRPDGVLGLVLEFCPNGSLLDHVRAMGRQIEEEEQKQQIDALAARDAVELCRQFPRFAWQICDAMLFLSEKGLVHRDLAARNVLLDTHMVARLSDFGLCLRMNSAATADEKDSLSSTKTNDYSRGIEEAIVIADEPDKLPIRWLAPESLERRLFSAKSDVWSFGVLLFELYSLGGNPFDGVEHRELLAHIRAMSPPGRPLLCPDSIYQLMRTCFVLDPGQRTGFGQLQAALTGILEEETGRYGYLALE